MAEPSTAAGSKRKAAGESADAKDGKAARAEPFELHERLAADCLVVKDLVLSRVLLLNDKNYPWLILVPRQNGITEAHQLSRADQHLLQDELAACASRVQSLSDKELARVPCWLKPTKMNVAALGNMVPQLHLHVIGRNKEDKAWPGPVWGKVPGVPYEEEELESALRLLREIIEPVVE